MNTYITLDKVSKNYGDTTALKDVTLDIPAGKIVGLVGPNGAGKTTLLRALTGLISCQGSIEILGLDPVLERAELMKRTGVIHDVSVLPPWMKVQQLLDFHEAMQPEFERAECEQYLETTSIQISKKVKHLSKGMKTQLHLSLMLATDSEILILDEPTHGLDILFRKQFYNSVLEDYFDHTKTILVSTHQIEEVEHILSDVIFIREGEILLFDSLDSLDERFIELNTTDQQADLARKYNPVTERKLIGKRVLLFEGVEPEQLGQYGEIKRPALADIFVALMGGKS